MRPVKLEMSAWGPYPGKICIDFEAVGRNHIFLLAGPTGAGKTTIFDGITYALYGNVSGKYREKDSVRSDFADVDKETYVELEFSHKEKMYIIRRSPRYDSPKKRGEGMRNRSEQAELHMPDGRVLSKMAEVSFAVNELLGIDYSQFKQISMIAQGEFLELLLADSDKRVKIFRNIFNTDVFNRIQLGFAERSKQLYAEISNLKIGMDTNIANISTENGELKSCMAQAQPDLHKILELLDAGNLSDKESVKILTSEIEEARRHFDQLTAKTERLSVNRKGLQEKISQIKALETNIKKLEKRLVKSDQALSSVHEYEKELNDIIKQLPVLEIQAVSVVKFENLGQRFANEKKNIKTLTMETKNFKQKVDKTGREIKRTAKEAQKLPGFENQCFLLAEKLKEKCNLRDLLAHILEKTAALDQMVKDHKKLAEDYLKNHEDTVKKKEIYETNDNRKKQASAGILALGLIEGSPCPVCGAIHHPQKAEIVHGVLNDVELDKLKIDYEKSAQTDEQILNKASRLKGSIDQLEQDIRLSIRPFSRRMKLAKASDSFQIREHTQQFYESLSCEIQKCQDQMELLEIKVSSAKKHVEAYKKLEMDLKTDTDNWNEAVFKLQEAEVVCSRIAGEYAQLKEQCPPQFKTSRDVDKKIQQLQLRKDKLLSKINDIKENAAAIQKEKSGQELWLNQILAGTDRTALEHQLKEFSAQMVEMQKEQNVLRKHIANLEAQRNQICIRLSNNRNIYQYLDARNPKKEALENTYGYVSSLDQVARGNNRKKLVFEQYVLSSYFQDILAAANIRLGAMTSGRYELFKVDTVYDRRRTNSLDIEVLDHYTGKKRSVKSLSGGESFKAALSLALGMSDIVQNNAGGIEIETLFIDEGFGSLDEDSLNQAVKTLMSLTQSNRLIGIISHVPELKGQIDDQILVEKTCRGSRLKFNISME